MYAKLFSRITEGDLKRRRKNDPDKLEIGARLRRETTLTIKAIAARVGLGTSKAANVNLHLHLQGGVQRAKSGNNRRRCLGRWAKGHQREREIALAFVLLCNTFLW